MNEQALKDRLQIIHEDYHDLLLLIRKSKILKTQSLRTSLKNTFANRETTLELIKFDEADLKSLKNLWKAHLKNLGKIAENLNLPVDIQELIEEVNTYLLTEKLIPS